MGVLGVAQAHVTGAAASTVGAALADAGVALGGTPSAGGLTVVAGRAEEAWPDLAAAAVVVAVDLGDDGDAAHRVSAMAEGARAAGWTVPWSGLVRMGSPPSARPMVVAVGPERLDLASALAGGPLGLMLDPVAGPATVADSRAARVLIASYEISGPTGNGGIGTAYHSMAHVLAAAGHDVTMLLTGWVGPGRDADRRRWCDELAAEGITFDVLGDPWAPSALSPHFDVQRAYELHRWLVREHARRPFDVLHVPECQGHGAFVLTAKALGLDFRDLEVVVGTHSSTRWVAECSREALGDLDLLVTEWLELLSIERADVLLSPTAYLVDYMRDRGWRLPERTFVQPLARPRSVRSLRARREQRAPSELVFFGRLETRKGLEAFCDAMDLLASDGGVKVSQVTFLGRPERVRGVPAEDMIAARAPAWGIPWKVLGDLGHAEAVSYLQEAPCLVVMPSLVDNSPNTVLETLAIGRPFVASRTGGTAELIDSRDLARVTFDGWAGSPALQPPRLSDREETFDSSALAAAVRARLECPGDAARAATDDAACDRAYDLWHRAVAGRPSALAPAAEPVSVGALVVAAGDDEAQPLVAALQAGTDRVDALEVLVETASMPGVGRRRAADRLGTDVVLVLPAGHVPDPRLVEVVRGAAGSGKSGVLAIATWDAKRRRFGPGGPVPAGEGETRAGALVPVGGPALAGLFYPAFAVGPYAITREALDATGGFAPDVVGADLDHDLLTRAALAGVRIDTIPEPLATTVKDDDWTQVRTHFWRAAPLPVTSAERLVRRMRPFRAKLPEELGDLPAVLAGEIGRGHDAASQLLSASDERQALIDSYEARIREQRDLIDLYEKQKEEMRRALNERSVAAPSHDARAPRLLYLRRVTRGPVREWPGRGVRFAGWTLHVLRRRMRRSP